jgi:hypothetical protein
MNQVMNKMKTPGGWQADREQRETSENKRGVVFYEYYIRRPAAGKAS